MKQCPQKPHEATTTIHKDVAEEAPPLFEPHFPVKEYFDKEVRFNVMIADVNKIIGEAIKDVL